MRSLPILALLVSACTGVATTTPAPDPAPPVEPAARASAATDPQPVTEGDVTESWVNGMQILVKRVAGAEITATSLHVRGGVRNWGREDSGVELLLLRAAAGGGTERLDKPAFVRRLAELGSTLQAASTEDGSSLSASCLTPRWDETFELLVDVFRRPALPASEVELWRQRQLAQLAQEQEQPDPKIRMLVNTTIFRDHPYGNRAIGTPDSVAALDASALRRHLRKLQMGSRLLLVVVGDVDAAHIAEAAHRGFGDLPRGDYRQEPLPPWRPTAPSLHVTEQKLATNYLLATFPAPGWGDPGHAAAAVAMFQLRQRVWEEVRTRRNLSYAPSAGHVDAGIARGALYVTAVDPRATWPVMLEEARKLRREPMSEADLRGAKSTLLTDFFVDNETSAAQAEMLARAELLGGDWRLAAAIRERVEAVTTAEVRAFALEHFGDLQAFVLGDPKQVDEALMLAPL